MISNSRIVEIVGRKFNSNPIFLKRLERALSGMSDEEKYEIVEYHFNNGRKVRAKLQSFICQTLELGKQYPFTNDTKKMPNIPKEAKMVYTGIQSYAGQQIRIFSEAEK